MNTPWIAAVAALFLWWFSTGIILWRVKRADQEGRDAHLFDRAVDNQVSRLRSKIEADSRNPQLILTVRGGGYRFAANVSRAAPERS